MIPQTIEVAAEALINGHLVIFPTETVYGVGADALNTKATNRIYEIKRRPKNRKLIVHISSFTLAGFWTEINKDLEALARSFWPGPLTVIVNSKNGEISRDLAGPKVAIRSPSNEIAAELLSKFEKLGGKGVVAPSANIFGTVSPTTLEAALDSIGNSLKPDDIVLDGGRCEIGIESTIVDITGFTPVIVRPGIISRSEIESCIKKIVSQGVFTEDNFFSGSSESHYKPQKALILNGKPRPGDAFIAMDEIATPAGSLRISRPKSETQFAFELYESLRCSDKLLADNGQIHVHFSSNSDLGIAIMNRLVKASSKY